MKNETGSGKVQGTHSWCWVKKTTHEATDNAYHLEKRHKNMKELIWMGSQHGYCRSARNSDFSNERTTTDTKQMSKKLLPFTKQDPSLIPTVGGCELYAWINNKLGKWEYVINSTMEKNTDHRVKHMPRPWSQQSEPNVDRREQSSWGCSVGQATCWAGRALPETRDKGREQEEG